MVVSSHRLVVVLGNLKVSCIDLQSVQNIGMWSDFRMFHKLKALWLVDKHFVDDTFCLSVLFAMDCIC